MPSPIKRIFVLMLENRSYDHLFGAINFTGTDPDTRKPTTSKGNDHGANYVAGHAGPLAYDLGHEFSDTLIQLCGANSIATLGQGGDAGLPGTVVAEQDAIRLVNGTYPTPRNDEDHTGFIADAMRIRHLPQQAAIDAMSSHTRATVPVLTQLAKEFALCDNWFSSLPGPTWPNRFFAVAGTAAGLDFTPSDARMFFSELGFNKFRFPNGTIFDKLSGEWLVAHGDRPPITLAIEGMGNLWDSSHFVSVDDLVGQLWQQGTDFRPRFVFIEPKYDAANGFVNGNSMHPRGGVAAGEALVKTVYEAIRNYCWEGSMLVVLFDEHGGFHDHVVPPAAIPPDDIVGQRHGFRFDRLGVRVPALVISSYTAKGLIDHTQYDHTSILRTVDDLLLTGDGSGCLGARAKAANSFAKLTRGPLRTDAPTTLVAPAAVPATEQEAAAAHASWTDILMRKMQMLES